MKTVLITGASSGIGKEFALKFAKKGYNLVLVSRRRNLLTKLKKEINNENINIDCYACDLTVNPKAVYDYCKKKKIQVDVLVNNAGFGEYGKFIDCNINEAKQMIDLNDKALVELTYYFIKDMKDNGYGHIINTASVASFVPGPYMAVYYASKAFVLSFSLALRQELKQDNIRVSTLCPGNTDTDFWKVAKVDNSKNSFTRTSEQAATTGMKMFEDNGAYAVDGLLNKLAVGIVRHLPLEFTSKVINYIQKNMKEKKDE